jgi:uncharacterized protein with ParB-like and HNH nuclease domain
MKIEPLNKVIGSLFGESNIYVVPKYQRAYSWQRDNVEEYCDDLWALYEKTKAGESVEHFLGSFVCVGLPSAPLEEKRVYQLVDGQQRLSTTCLLASRIIKKMLDYSEDLDLQVIVTEKVKKIKKKYICYYPEENDKYECTRIQLSHKDKAFYEELLLNHKAPYNPETSPVSHKLLNQAVSHIDDWLSKFEGGDGKETISNLVFLEKTFSSSFRIINILMDKQSDAYKIFQVINDRGRSLSAADLLRATTLGMMEELGARGSEIEKVEECWNNITTGGDKSADYFLETYYVSKMAKKMQRSAIYDLFMVNFFTGKDVKGITSEVQSILESKNKIDLIKAGKWPYASAKYTPYQQNKLSNIIKLFKHTQCIPLLLSASRHKEKKFYQLVFLIEKFFFRFKVVSDRRFDPAAKAYFLLIKEINYMQEQYQLRMFVAALSKIIQDRSPAADMATYLNELKFDAVGDNRIIKFVLSTVEEGWIWAGKDYPKGILGAFKYHSYDLFSSPSNLSIEHIYAKTAKVKDHDIEPIKHTLGNLCVLLSKANSDMGDDSFKDKREAYKASGFNLAAKVSEEEIWDVNSLEKHKELIVDRAIRILSI